MHLLHYRNMMLELWSSYGQLTDNVALACFLLQILICPYNKRPMDYYIYICWVVNVITAKTHLQCLQSPQSSLLQGSHLPHGRFRTCFCSSWLMFVVSLVDAVAPCITIESCVPAGCCLCSKRNRYMQPQFYILNHEQHTTAVFSYSTFTKQWGKNFKLKLNDCSGATAGIFCFDKGIT